MVHLHRRAEHAARSSAAQPPAAPPSWPGSQGQLEPPCAYRDLWVKSTLAMTTARAAQGNAGLASMIGPRFGSSSVVQPPPSAWINATLSTSRLCLIDKPVC